jgi:curved DNA-binding protein CbpA
VADAEDLEKLCQGPRTWNDWRAESPERIPDLRSLRLTLSQRQFGPSNGGPINLQDTDLEGAELRHANLTGAQMAYANLVAADLVHARLNDADLTGADLTDAMLDNADLTGAKLDRAILTGASLGDARGLTQAQIDAAYGDASTVVPASVMPPASWFPPVEDDDFFNECRPPEMLEEVDLYEVLGVASDAKPEEIRSAFRILVKQLHPDLNPDDVEAQEAFKRVSAAYRILNNPETRRRYDRGEIGTDGEVNPEFEAKRQFRRYAFRFYTAAAGSLVLAVGVLVAVWYVVLTDSAPDRSRVEIAIDAPPKHVDRLDEKLPAAQLPAASAERQTEPVAAPPANELAEADSDDGAATLDARSENETAKPEEQSEVASQDQPDAAKDDAAPAAAPALGPVKEARSEPEKQLASNATAGDAAPTQGPVKEARTEPEKQPASSATGGDAPQPSATIQTSADLQLAPTQGLTPAATPVPNPGPAQSTVDAAAAASDQAAPPAPPAANQTPPAGKPDRMANLTEPNKIEPQAEAKPAELPAASASPAPETPAAATPPSEPGPQANARPTQQHQPDGAVRPLGKENSGNEARPAKSDAARFSSPAPFAPKLAAKADPKSVFGFDGAPRPQSTRDGLVLRSTLDARRRARGPISKLFRSRAIRNSMAQDKINATASFDSPAGPDKSGPDEVWDLYTHSLPDTDEKSDRPWPESLVAPPPIHQKRHKPHVPVAVATPTLTSKADPQRASSAPAPAAAAASTPSPIPPGAAAPDTRIRKQAVSDILSGGLQ